MPGGVYICNIFFYIPFTTFQEECLKRLDNKPSEPKIKRKNLNPYRKIVTSDAVFEKVFENIQNARITKIEKC